MVPKSELIGSGTCFQDTEEIIETVHEIRSANQKTVWICHAICLLDDVDGESEYSHAWVECGNWVYQIAMCPEGSRLVVKTPKNNHYKRCRVKDITRYSQDRFRKLKKKLGGPPWLARYCDLTK